MRWIHVGDRFGRRPFITLQAGQVGGLELGVGVHGPDYKQEPWLPFQFEFQVRLLVIFLGLEFTWPMIRGEHRFARQPWQKPEGK